MKWRGTVDKVLYSDSADEGPAPDFNPNTLCNPRQVPPLSWDSSFLLLFACLVYCNYDLWGREGDNVPWLRIPGSGLLQQKSSEQPEGLLVKTLLSPRPHQHLAGKQLSSWQLCMLQASSVAPGNCSEVGDFPEWQGFPTFSWDPRQ